MKYFFNSDKPLANFCGKLAAAEFGAREANVSPCARKTEWGSLKNERQCAGSSCLPVLGPGN